MITDTSYDSADHQLLLTELRWLNIRQLIMFDLGIFMFNINRGSTPQSVNNMFNNIGDIHHYQIRAPCRSPNKQITEAPVTD